MTVIQEYSSCLANLPLWPHTFIKVRSTTSRNHMLQNNLHNIQRKVALIFQCTFTPSCLASPLAESFLHILHTSHMWKLSMKWLFFSKIIKKTFHTLLVQGCEWVIKFNGLSGDSGQQGPYSPYKPCNHSLYIGIIIFPHIDNTQSRGHNQLQEKRN